MIRKLLIVAASALVLAMVSLSLGWLIGGKEFLEKVNHDGVVINWDDKDHKGPRTTRTMPFNANQLMVIEAPVELEFTRGTENSITIEGPVALVDALRIENGRFFLAKKGIVTRGGLKIRINAAELPPLELRGPGNIELNDLQQKLLKLDIAGAANIEASGRVEMVEIDASGAGNLDLERLSAVNGKIAIAGFGNADVRVSNTLDAEISGAGNITLHEKPKQLNSNISGIGSVDESY